MMSHFFVLPDQAHVWLGIQTRERRLAVERVPGMSGRVLLRAGDLDDGIGAERPDEGGWVLMCLPTVRNSDLLLGEIAFKANAAFPDAAARARRLRTTLSRSIRRLAVVPVFAKNISHGARARNPSAYASREAIAEYGEHLRQKDVPNIIYVTEHGEPPDNRAGDVAPITLFSSV